MDLIIKKDNIISNGVVYKLEDLYSEEFYAESNKVSGEYIVSSYLVNELFLYIVQPFLAVNFFIKKTSPEHVVFSKPDRILSCYFSDACCRLKISVKGNGMKKVFVRFAGDGSILATFFYIFFLLMRIPYEKIDLHWSEFTLTRDKASYSKMRNFNFHKEKEDPWSSDSIYRYFNKSLRIKWLWRSLWTSFAETKKLYIFLKEKTGKKTATKLYERYSKRIVHTYLYANLLDELFKINSGSTYFTGLNLERFAIIEDMLAEKHNIRTICIPHGLEYGYKFPYGFSTQLFYTTSANAASHLNKLYGTQKFVFDASVAEKMFRTKSVVRNSEKRVVFFSEPREPFVNINILRELLPKCEDAGIELYIKHHPGDNLDDYKEFDGRLHVLNNLDEALTNNICFARKSTTLIEALYNGSKVAAIITNNKDKSIFSTFPSLQDENINVFYDINSLFDWIVKEIKQ